MYRAASRSAVDPVGSVRVVACQARLFDRFDPSHVRFEVLCDRFQVPCPAGEDQRSQRPVEAADPGLVFEIAPSPRCCRRPPGAAAPAARRLPCSRPPRKPRRLCCRATTPRCRPRARFRWPAGPAAQGRRLPPLAAPQRAGCHPAGAAWARKPFFVRPQTSSTHNELAEQRLTTAAAALAHLTWVTDVLEGPYTRTTYDAGVRAQADERLRKYLRRIHVPTATLRISGELIETLSRQVGSLGLSPEQLLFSSTGRADGNPVSRNTFRTKSGCLPAAAPDSASTSVSRTSNTRTHHGHSLAAPTSRQSWSGWVICSSRQRSGTCIRCPTPTTRRWPPSRRFVTVWLSRSAGCRQATHS